VRKLLGLLLVLGLVVGISGCPKKEKDKKDTTTKKTEERKVIKKDADDKTDGDKKEGDKTEGDKKEGDKKEGDKKEGDKKATDVGKITIDAKGVKVVNDGKDVKATIKVKRDNYKGPVTVKVDAGDSKVKVDKDEYTIGADKDSVDIMVSAEKSTSVGDKEIKVTASGDDGKPVASMTLKVTVEKK
jgi:hypothetical protein